MDNIMNLMCGVDKRNGEKSQFISDLIVIGLNRDYENMLKSAKHMMGYQVNVSMNYNRLMTGAFKEAVCTIPLNNAGSPYDRKFMATCERKYEVYVLNYYYDVFGIKNGWGYISSGGQASNYEGHLRGRNYLAGHDYLSAIRNNRNLPILYMSEESHYSAMKSANDLAIEYVIIPTHKDGSIRCDILLSEIKSRPSNHAIVHLNYGTTYKGAIDNISEVSRILQSMKGIKSYIHIDAALFGGYAPYADNNMINMLRFDMNPSICSISISNHKFMGSSMPSSMFLTTDKYSMSDKSTAAEYVGIHNSIMACSRNAVASTFLYARIATLCIDPDQLSALKSSVSTMLSLAVHMNNRINGSGYYKSYVNKYSNTVYFYPANNLTSITNKYSLSYCTYKDDNDEYDVLYCHIVILPHITGSMLDEFYNDIMTLIPKHSDTLN